MKIRWILAVLVLALFGTQDVIAETLYCNNNARRDLIEGGKICDPGGSVSGRCLSYPDNRLAEKMACYAERDACFARVKQQNQQIKQENDLYYKCKAAFDRDKGNKPGNTQNKWKSRLKQAQQRNQDMSGAKRRNDQAYERAVNNEVKKTQKVWRQNAIEAERENQARRAAQERQRQTTRSRQQRAQSAGSTVRQRSSSQTGGWGDISRCGEWSDWIHGAIEAYEVSVRQGYGSVLEDQRREIKKEIAKNCRQ